MNQELVYKAQAQTSRKLTTLEINTTKPKATEGGWISLGTDGNIGGKKGNKKRRTPCLHL